MYCSFVIFDFHPGFSILQRARQYAGDPISSLSWSYWEAVVLPICFLAATDRINLPALRVIGFKKLRFFGSGSIARVLLLGGVFAHLVERVVGATID